MGNARTSNKDILEAINAQTQAISGLVTALAGNAPAQVTPEPANVTPLGVIETSEPKPVTNTDAPKVDAKYMAHMESKVGKLTKSDGQERVLYLRRNLAGEVKLAYCLAERWATLKDNGKMGAVQVFK